MPTTKSLMPLHTPCIVFDTETTGFPGDKGSFRARIIEIGAVVLTTDGRVVSPINFFVWQPLSHLHHPIARRAMKVHQISATTIQEEGLRPLHAAERLHQWIERVQARHQVQEARAYNQSFDFWFLQREPWSLFTRTSLTQGEDIKETARQVMRAIGATKHAPPLSATVSFLASRGHPIRWEANAHRAMEDARIAAWCAVFLERERRALAQTSR